MKSKFFGKDKMYGTTTVGERGQVVIPAEARKDLSIKPGDRLLVVGKFGRVLGLIKAENLESFIDVIMDAVENVPKKHELKQHFNKFLKELK